MIKFVENFTIIFFFIAVFAILAATGEPAYKDDVRNELEYCEKVKDKTWPDFKGVYKNQCTPERLKEIENILR